MKEPFGKECLQQESSVLVAQPDRFARRKRAVWVVLLFLLAPSLTAVSQRMVLAGSKPFSLLYTDEQRLAGYWIRPDGGYILELKDVRQDGSLQAAYYNPRPIRVFTAKWNRNQGVLGVVVELRDVNYPGSIYSLQYDQNTDSLKGAYFQAAQKKTYLVEFIRKG